MIHGTAATVWTLWTTVGMSNRPTLGRMRRALLGLAALALERLEQDRLLAEHVGALDRPDRDHDVVPGAEDVEADEAGFLGRADGRLEPADGLGRVGPDRDDDLARADREGGDRRALEDGERVVLEQEPVGAGRRVRAVAVDHDVAARRVRSPAAVRHLSAAGNPAPPRPRSPELAIVAIVAVPPRSRMTRRSASNAPSRVAASRSVGSGRGGAGEEDPSARSSGVLSRAAIRSGPRRLGGGPRRDVGIRPATRRARPR